MGSSFSELDAQLAALGSVRGDILQIARKLVGDTGSLADVDQQLSALGSRVQSRASTLSADVNVSRSAGLEAAAPRPRKKPAPQLVTPPAATSAREATSSSDQAESRATSLETPIPQRNGPPHSEEIALPEPVQHDEPSPRSGELALDGAAPRSGSFALDPAPLEPSLDEDTDADFEAEFAALSGSDATRAKSTRPKSMRPATKVESVRPEAKAPEPVQLVSDEDEETDAVLALFDAADAAPEAAPIAPLESKPIMGPSSVSSIGGLSDELEPSVAPPPLGSRDPDAEFDALFDEASSPSSVPSTPASAGDQDSVDDLLRDLGSPRVPQDLAANIAQAKSLPPAVEDDAGDDPTGIFDASTFDAVTGGQSAKGEASPPAEEDEDFEIEMDLDEVIEDEEPKATKPAAPPPRGRPQPPSVPGGVEKRPSFLGRLFGGPNHKDPDNK